VGKNTDKKQNVQTKFYFYLEDEESIMWTKNVEIIENER
jgi:hypothetical protein